MARAARIGIFGGTFDPVHQGHVDAAETVRETLGLDRMLMVVANEPWQKEGVRAVTPAEDRYALVAAAVEGHPGLEPCRMELERGGPSYTIDTVCELRRREPACSLYVVVGADVVPGLPTWRSVDELARLTTLVVVDRPGVPFERPGEGWRWVAVAVPPFDVSSTELRARLAAGGSLAGLVPEGVIRCIRQRNLYATSG